MTDEGGIRIIVADERALFRDAAQGALDAELDLTVVGSAANAFEAVDRARLEQPDVVIVSDDLAGASTTATVEELVEAAPRSATLILLASDRSAARVVALLQAGARGCVTSDAPLVQLVAATRAAVRGEVALSRSMATVVIDHLIDGYRSREAALVQLSQLTGRERQVLAILARGGSNETIAQELVISTQTARTHVSHLLSKLGVHSRLEAVATVVRHGLLDQLEAEVPR